MAERKRTQRKRGPTRDNPTRQPVWPGLRGGAFKPLADRDLERIHQTALDLLAEVGLRDATPCMIETLTGRGAWVDSHGFIRYPRALVEDAIAGFRRDIVLHGSTPGHELELRRGRIYTGSGGAAPAMLDLTTGQYRAARLTDLYDCARLVDALEHIHFFSRSVTATDMTTDLDLDINTAYASLKGTTKHIASSISSSENVAAVVALCHTIAGGKAAFDARPFLSLNINHVTPPLRFAPVACEVMAQAARLGLPFFVNSFDQAGASAPVSLMASVAQCVAECLAGMVYIWLLNPRAMAIFGPRPLITDLRTGALTGGGGEQAIAMAAAAQMGHYYDLPCSGIAGATDSKLPDAQSGFEKALAITLAAHAGCNLITQSCGMQAALMGCSLESYIIDNDMLGAILRSVRGLEPEQQDLSMAPFRAAVHGDGHFLGAADTLARMNTDFLYPHLSDRRSIEQWTAAGQPELGDTARQSAREILTHHFPNHLSATIDEQIRTNHKILLRTEYCSRPSDL